MKKPYPEHPLTYRQEILGPLFSLLHAGESVMLVGAASMSKSNLIRFLLHHEVQAFYQGEADLPVLPVLVDINRLAIRSGSSPTSAAWAFYELVLHSLALELQRRPEMGSALEVVSQLHQEVVLNENGLLALRRLERAVDCICHDRKIRLALLIDEADPFYQQTDANILFNLRGLRDQYKYFLCYVLFLRTSLEHLRETDECESFDELFNRNILGLKPYTVVDAERVALQLEARKEFELSAEQRRSLLEITGGHPGLIVAGFDLLARAGQAEPPFDPAFWLEQPEIAAECQKIWDSLQADEHFALQQAIAGLDCSVHSPGIDQLLLKGLLVADSDRRMEIFSPLLAGFVERKPSTAADFWVDEKTATVWVSGKSVSDLTPGEFQLLKILYQQPKQIFSRAKILELLYPNDVNQANQVNDNRVDKLVSNLRLKIEPDPKKPRYIYTKHGHGYYLQIDRKSGD
jgi:DNA-binding winged helix-turn-helix (wHTH) protein